MLTSIESFKPRQRMKTKTVVLLGWAWRGKAKKDEVMQYTRYNKRYRMSGAETHNETTKSVMIDLTS